MRPFDNLTDAIAWLNTAPGVCAASQCVIVRYFAVTLIYVDHEFGWLTQAEVLHRAA